MVPKVRAALAGLGGPGAEAIIADAAAPGALARALADPTFGTRITAGRRPRGRGGMSAAVATTPTARHDGPARTAAGAPCAPPDDPRPRRRPRDRQPGGARRAPARARLRRHPGDRQPRHHRARPGEGAPRRRPRLRRAPEDRRRAAAGRPRRRPGARRRPPAADPRRHPGHDRAERAHPRPRPARPAPPASIAQAIDESRLDEQEGTLAGDNTLLVLFADEPASSAGSTASRPSPPVRPTAFPTPTSRPPTPDQRRHSAMKQKVVLAYSGGLDTSVAVAWLREQFDAEVVTLTVDVGGGSLREGVERRAMSAGASRGLRRRRARDVRHRLRAGRTSRRTRSTRAPTRWPPRSPGRSSPSSSSRSPRTRGRRRGRPRLHRQGQRPGPLRRRRPRPRPGARGHRPDARRDGPDPRPGDRLRDRARDRDPDHEGVARTRST